MDAMQVAASLAAAGVVGLVAHAAFAQPRDDGWPPRGKIEVSRETLVSLPSDWPISISVPCSRD